MISPSPYTAACVVFFFFKKQTCSNVFYIKHRPSLSLSPLDNTRSWHHHLHMPKQTSWLVNSTNVLHKYKRHSHANMLTEGASCSLKTHLIYSPALCDSQRPKTHVWPHLLPVLPVTCFKKCLYNVQALTQEVFGSLESEASKTKTFWLKSKRLRWLLVQRHSGYCSVVCLRFKE